MRKTSLFVIGILAGIMTYTAAFGVPSYNVYDPREAQEILRPDDKAKILFIVDFSNSMEDFLGGERKSDIAVRTLADIVSRLNPSVKTGLRVYGHRFVFNPILACKASDLAVPVLPNNSENIKKALYSFKPTGQTPITYSLKSAINRDFADITGEKRIVLLTDGAENCDESPCEYAIKVVSQRDDVKIDVIAFNVNDDEAQAQLKCTSSVTGGKIYNAKTAAELAKSLEQSLNVTTEVQGTIIKK